MRFTFFCPRAFIDTEDARLFIISEVDLPNDFFATNYFGLRQWRKRGKVAFCSA
jgi:hypothetical protein